jgi:hypothetical protein
MTVIPLWEAATANAVTTPRARGTKASPHQHNGCRLARAFPPTPATIRSAHSGNPAYWRALEIAQRRAGLRLLGGGIADDGEPAERIKPPAGCADVAGYLCEIRRH